MSQSRLNRAVFLYDKASQGHNWSKCVKKILNDHDLIRFWNENQPVPLELAKTKISERFQRDWEHHCATKPKLRTYISFKSDTKVAAHINCNMPKFERSLISQLRLGILPLRIETGRYSNLNVAERTCLICNSGEVEDENHFLFDCAHYVDEREILLHDIGDNFDDMNVDEKFRVIFEHPFKLGNYVKKAMYKRRQILYNIT